MVLNLQLTPNANGIMKKGLKMSIEAFEEFLNENLKQLVPSEEIRRIRGETFSFGKSYKLLVRDLALILKPHRYKVYDYAIVNIINRTQVNADERKYKAFENEFNDEIKLHPPGITTNYCYNCGAELTVNET
jgi:hypothetical protein